MQRKRESSYFTFSSVQKLNIYHNLIYTYFNEILILQGATSGIGAETARVLAKRGARLVIPARNLKAAEEMKARITSEFPATQIIVMRLDLSSLKSVKRFVSDFEALDLPLNLLM